MAVSLPGAWAQEETSENPAPLGESPSVMPTEDSARIIEIEEFIAVGSRRQDRPAADSPVAGKTFPHRDTRTWTQCSPQSSLPTTSTPSRSATPPLLYGLPSDSTLVLINGRRRHRASVITFLGGGIVDGSQGPDLAAIPYIALEQVGVLRDGASAQYGSDAVAGVMNFVLKDDAHGGLVETRWGQHYEGDGGTYTVAANAGMPLMRRGELNGFANLSVEYTEANSHQPQPPT